MHHLNQLTQSLYWSYFLYTVYVGKTRYLKTWVCLCSKIHEQKYKFGVNRPIPEVNCYDCVDKSLIEVRRDYYDLLVSLPKYVQQIRSFCSTPPPAFIVTKVLEIFQAVKWNVNFPSKNESKIVVRCKPYKVTMLGRNHPRLDHLQKSSIHTCQA